MSADTLARLQRRLANYDPAAEAHTNAAVTARLAACPDRMIFGAGQNGRLVLAHLRAAGLPPAAFIDETPAKIGTVVEDTPVISPAQAAMRPGGVVISSIFSPAHGYGRVAERLVAMGLAPVSLFRFLRALGTTSLPFYFLAPPETVVAAAPQIAWLASQLADEASLDLLGAQVEFRLSLRHEALPPWTTRRRPPPASWDAFGLIDAGAFDGDTLLPFLAEHGQRVRRAVALEPDRQTFARLERNIAATGLENAARTLALRCAVDATVGRRAFADLGHQGSQFSDGGAPVETLSIDAVVAAHLQGCERLYLKLDVEGAEAEALVGAARTIAGRRPLIAISAYHRPDDLWALPRLVSDIDDGYRFALASHGADGADLMVYALPPDPARSSD